MEGDWAELPGDILDSLLEKLVLFTDYVRFGAVCRSWHRATLSIYNQKGRIEYDLSSYNHHRVPLLLYPPPYQEEEEIDTYIDTAEKEHWVRSLYSVTQKRVVCEELEFVAPGAGADCFGSSHGWLITVSASGIENYISLVNPFYITGGGGGGRIGYCKKGIIKLPPLAPMSHYTRIEKVVLSANPADDPVDGYLVVVLFFSFHSVELAWLNSSENHWMHLQIPSSIGGNKLSHNPSDMVFHQGLIYLVHFDGRLDVCNPSGEPRFQNLAPPLPLAEVPGVITKYYLVKSPPPDSDLLLVGRDHTNLTVFHLQTIAFNIFKLVKIGSLGSRWIKLKSIESRVIFVGDNYSTCVLAEEGDGLLHNSIYFTDNVATGNFDDYLNQIPGLWDMSIYSYSYNLSDGSFDCHYRFSTGPLISYPVWFIPSIPHPN